MRKIDITQEQFDAIKKAYLKDLLSFSQIEEKLGFSQDFTTRVLKEWGIFVPWPKKNKDTKKGDLKKEHSRLKKEKLKENIQFHNKKSKSPFEPNKDYQAVCKLTGTKFSDYLNKSGVITKHLRDVIGVSIPTGYHRRSYEKTHGKPWHSLYFEFIEDKQEGHKKRQCAYCDWSTVDTDNKSGWYTSHIKEIHGISIKEHISSHPEEKGLFQTALQKEEDEFKYENKTKNEDYVECVVCGEKMKYITNSHLKKHGMSCWEYKIKFPRAMTSSMDFKSRMTKQLGEVQHLAIPRWVSNPESNIRDFLSEYELDMEYNNRSLLSGTEIDILIPSKRIGIEFNGNLYHSEGFGKKDRMFHLNKLTKMNSVGYSLVQIFEDEWEEKQPMVKNKLIRLLSLNGSNIDLEKINARKCEIAYLNPKEKNEFLNEHHIQGQDRSTIHIGLVYEDDLVSVMTFDPHRNMTNKKEDNVYELKRYATRSDTMIRGGAGKLLSFFIKNHSPYKIISFADRRWTLDAENNMYTKIGFSFNGSTPPEYHYFNQKVHRLKRWSKFNFGKSSIATKFPDIYHPDKTEWQMMQEAGYDRIWDCGKYRYELLV